MGRKRKDEEKSGFQALFDVREETRYWICSIFSFALALFLLLAAFGIAGVFGERVFMMLRGFLGIGYYLLPLILVLFGVAFVRTGRPNLLWTTGAGSLLLFLSGMGLLGAFSPEAGGTVGGLIATPLISLIDIYATIVTLGAVFLASLLITFDIAPSLDWFGGIFSIFGRNKDADVDVAIVDGTGQDSSLDEEEADGDEEEEDGDDTDEEEGAEEDEEDDEAEEETTLLKKVPLAIFGRSAKKVSPLKMYTSDDYTPPPISLFEKDRGKPGVGDLKANANIIRRTLQNFGINVEMDEISVGPSVARYALKPAQGVKLSRIVGLQNDLALALAAHPIRIEAPIPGKSLVGIEIPNTAKTTVGLASLFGELEFAESAKPLLISLGRNVTGKPHFGDLAKMPHLLIAGATGSGKSVSIHTIISSLVRRNGPANLRFIMIDPKRVELTLYKNIPHLLTPVITDAKKAILALKWAAKEMDRRYDVLESESVRDIASYHKNIVEPAYQRGATSKESDAEGEEDVSRPERMPYVVIIIDELADIMSAYPRELEAAIIRLAQMSRATGIHLILSTQRPSVNVITGLIKANVPSRMAFQVASQTDSRTILDAGGAEKLLGAGDMLFASGDMGKPVRLQGAFIGEDEIKHVVKFLTKQGGEETEDLGFTENPSALTEGASIFDALEDDDEGDEEDDDLFEDARAVVVETGKASTTFLQRKLRIGYARAARLMDILEERGVVGPASGAKPREVLVSREEGYGTSEEESGDEDAEDSKRDA